MKRAVALILALAVVAVPAAADARVPLRKSFARGLDCGPTGTAHVHGELSTAVVPHLRLTRSDARIRSARAVATLSGSADLAVEASGGVSCGLAETPVASWYAPPIRFAAGLVPVVVVPKITIYLSAEVHARVPVSARVRGSFEATAGLRYNGRVHRIGRFTQRLSADQPTGRSATSVGARLIPSLELRVYGLAGPRFDFGTGLEFDAGPPRELSIPVELRAGLELPGLDIGPVTVLSRSIPLRRSVPAQDADPVERARIAWDTAADVDLHVWDASGRHSSFHESGIPGVLLSKDDTDGFGPETLEETDAAGRPLTYGVCLFDSRGAGATRVTAQLIERDSAARTAYASLSSEGDSALLAGDFAPPAGWCRPRH